MLKGLDPVLSADLLWVLASMGHGDDLVLVDGNHPAETIARTTTSGRLIRLPGVAMERAAAAILSVLPIDDFEAAPLRRMQVVGAADAIPDVQRAVQGVIDHALGRTHPLVGIERFARRFGFAVSSSSSPACACTGNATRTPSTSAPDSRFFSVRSGSPILRLDHETYPIDSASRDLPLD